MGGNYGKKIAEMKTDPQNEDENEERRPLDRMADYSDLSSEELLQSAVLKQQTENTVAESLGSTGEFHPMGMVVQKTVFE